MSATFATSSRTDALQRALLAWFQAARRDLPWRAGAGRPAPTPYAVLVSELMAQQTRVETVIPYFERWMQRWPTVAELAAAPLQEVLEHWSGLGYYRRARHLHAAAQAVVARHGGAIPSEIDALAALPGLGPYTVGAVRSIGLGLPTAAVDGNAGRVLARWLAARDPLASTAGRKAVWAAAEALAHAPAASAAPGAWTQALMELGATLCTPRRPDCGRCPVHGFCQARAEGLETQLPTPTARRKPLDLQAVCALLVRVSADGSAHALIGLRPEQGRWAGLWEPPTVEGPQAETRMGQWLAAQGLPAGTSLPPLVHVLTHRRYRVTLLRVPVQASASPDLRPLNYAAARWQALPVQQQRGGGLSRLAWRALAALDPDDPDPVQSP